MPSFLSLRAWCFLLLCWGGLWGNEVAAHGTPPAPLVLTPYVSVLQDATGALSLADLQNPDIAATFQTASGSSDALSFGLTKATIWLRFTVENPSSATLQRMLEVGYARLSSVTLYEQTTGGGYRSTQTGMTLPFATRPVPNRFFAFPVSLVPQSKTVFYLRVQSTNAISIPLKLWEPVAFSRNERHDYAVQAIYFGMAWAMILFNLLLFVALRSPVYGYYALYASCMALTFGEQGGLTTEFMWPNAVGWTAISTGFAYCSTAASLLFFMRSMLQTRLTAPRADRFVILLVCFYFAVILGLIADYASFVKVATVTHMVTLATVFGIAVYAMTQRVAGATFFFAAFFVFCGAGLLSVLRALGYIPVNFVTVNLLQFGSAIEMVLLAFALADRFDLLRREKNRLELAASQAQREAIEALQASERSLEARVADRTMQLQQSEQKLFTVLEHVEACIYMKDVEGRYLYANRMMRSVTGIGLQNAPAQRYEDLSDTAASVRLTQGDSPVLLSGEATHAELEVPLYATGSVARFIVYKIPLKNEVGDIYALCGIATDITERTLLEEQKQKLIEERLRIAVEQGKARVHFLAQMSHELRAPLTSILGYTQLMQRGASGLSTSEVCAAIHGSGLRLLNMVNEILDYARGQTDQVKPDLEPVDWAMFLKGLKAYAELLAQTHGNSFRIEEHGTAPEVVIIDERRVRQVLDNLLSNANRYTNKGRITLHCLTTLIDPKSVEVVMSVSDTGVGIDINEQSLIFEPFVRGTNARHENGSHGVGLGLAIARQVMQQLGGTLTLDSTPGEGSCFRAAWQCALAPAPSAQPAFRKETWTGKLIRAYAGSRRRVLVVDDDPIALDILTRLFVEVGLTVLQALSGRTAVALCSEEIDLIVTDQFMQDGDGWYVLEAARRILPGVPVLLMSAAPAQVPLDWADANRFDETLLKPWNEQELLSSVGRLLEIEWLADSLPSPQSSKYQQYANSQHNLNDVPDVELLEELRVLVQLGSYSDLLTWADTLALTHPKLAPFANRVQRATRVLDFAELSKMTA